MIFSAKKGGSVGILGNDINLALDLDLVLLSLLDLVNAMPINIY